MIAGPDTSAPNSAGGALVDPIFDYDHSHGDCAIIGGYVYRGSKIPGLVGQYLYTDNCNGKIRALTRSGATATNRDLGVTAARRPRSARTTTASSTCSRSPTDCSGSIRPDPTHLGASTCAS